MANTFDFLVPALYEAAAKVNAERAGALDSINRNIAARPHEGGTIKIPIAPASAASGSYTPSMNLNGGSLGTDVDDDGVTLTLDQNKVQTWHLTGEQERQLANTGMLEDHHRQMAAQAMRRLRNEAETYVCALAKKGASRAAGTAGTTPFATANDFSDFAAVLRILEDNGCPSDQLSLIIDPAAAQNIRGKQSSLFKANEAASEAMLRRGELGTIEGLAVKVSAGIALHTKGTGTSYQTNNASGYAIGDRTIAVDTGSGTALQGDCVTFTGDANVYVINTALSGGSLTIGRPGLRATLADNVAMTIGNSYTPNFALNADAIQLAWRAPIIPKNPAIRQEIVGDPEVGLTYLFCEVVGDGVTTWRLHALYGGVVVNGENIAILRG